MNRLILALGALLIVAACGDATEQIPAPKSVDIGHARFSYTDPERSSWTEDGDRPIRGWIWYPAEGPQEPELVAFPEGRPVFVGGYSARNAPPAEGPARPLVVLSHGTGGSGFGMMWLARRLADAGYVVAAPDHHGNTAAEEAYDPRGFRMFWERPQDISVLIDRLLADPEWEGRIDRERIGAVGFSLGGYTVTALAGGRIDLEAYAAFCESPRADATCGPQPEYPEAGPLFEEMLAKDPTLAAAIGRHGDDYSDPRIRTVAALAPALGSGFTADSLASIDRPVLVIVGDADETTPAATGGQVVAEGIPGAEFVMLDATDHYSFLNPCTPRGKRFVPACTEVGRNRQAIHEEAAELVLDHLSETLGNNASSDH